MVSDEPRRKENNKLNAEAAVATEGSATRSPRVNEWRGKRGPDPRPLGLLLLHLLAGEAPCEEMSSPPVEGGHLTDLPSMRDLLLSCLAPSPGVRPALREVLNTLGMRRLDACPTIAISAMNRAKGGAWSAGKSLDFFAGPKVVQDIIQGLKDARNCSYEAWFIPVLNGLEQKVKNDYLRVLGAAAAGSFDTIEGLVQTFISHVRYVAATMSESLASASRVLRPMAVHPQPAYYDYGAGQVSSAMNPSKVKGCLLDGIALNIISVCIFLPPLL